MALQVEYYRDMLRAYRKARRADPDQAPPPPIVGRPRTRGDCIDGPRPCPYLGCRHNLLLDVQRNGGLRYRDGVGQAYDPDDPRDSCALDAAERGGMHLGQIGEALSCTDERVRQEEEVAMAKFRAALPRASQLGLNEVDASR